MTPLEVLKKYWHYDAFRPLQAEIIQSVLDGKDVVALLPTGGGKSLCFQVPGMCLNGITLVVSPLLSLIKDQVERLKRQGIKAYAVHSGLHFREIDLILDNCIHDKEVKFLYISPERIQSELFQERVRRMPISLLAIDEAHCVSQWGHDFRPSYLLISDIKRFFPNLNTIALTATATPAVLEDIQQQLGLKKVQVFRQSFLRNNLSLSCLKPENKEKKLIEILSKVPGSAVVYLRSRKGCETISKLLHRNMIKSDFYHAGLAVLERSKRQEAWLKGDTRVMVATNAFGMGIDKPDVRLVVHLDIPDNPEAYFQEAGRAGRDGNKAFAVLLYNERDHEELKEKIQHKYPENSIIRSVYQALANYYKIAVGSSMLASYDFDEVEFARLYKFSRTEVYFSLRRLEQEGYIQLPDEQDVTSRIMIVVDAVQLYDFQLTHPKLDLFIKTLLRMYGGELYTGFVPIQESQLSKVLGISQEECIQKFEVLQKNGMLVYEPKKVRPQLIFTMPRQDASKLNLVTEKIKALQDRDEARALSMIHYSSLDRGCRNQFLLSYFGENLPNRCGICDLCIAEKKNESSNNSNSQLMESILMLIKTEKKTPTDILELYSDRYTEEVLTTIIRALLDDGKIGYAKDGSLILLGK